MNESDIIAIFDHEDGYISFIYGYNGKYSGVCYTVRCSSCESLLNDEFHPQILKPDSPEMREITEELHRDHMLTYHKQETECLLIRMKRSLYKIFVRPFKRLFGLKE